jgi:hypothetical protein
MKDQDKSATIIATKLATETAVKAADLATLTASTAVALATKTAETTAIISNDISWMKKSLIGIENKLNEMDKAFVTSTQHAEVLRVQEDHENRIRSNETSITRILTWGSALILLLGIVEFLLNMFVR